MNLPNMLAILTIWASQLVTVLAESNFGSLENVEVFQNLDIKNPYLEQEFDIRCQNVGTEDVYDYYFVIPESKAKDLALLVVKNSRTLADLEVERVSSDQLPGNSLFRFKFDTNLEPAQTAEFHARLAFSRGSSPYPAEAKQTDTQWMLYEGTQNYVSLYKTRSQTTEINAATDKHEILSETGLAEHVSSDPTGHITFGPLEDLEPLASIPLRYRYETPVPHSFVENLNRSIWVSHWGGSVSFDESYDIHNVGTRIKDSFSRLDFSRPRIGLSLNNAAINFLRIALPEGHREEYYVDLVGNVSTSKVNEKSLDIQPRYPVMGGWFYNFTIGWASDLSKFVHKTTSLDYVLSVPVIGGPRDIAYGKVFTKIILPEGAYDAEVYSEVPITDQHWSLTHSYLDIFGRLTVDLQFNNLVSEYQDDNILLTYRYSILTALKKPFSYIVAISACMLGSKFIIELF